MPIDPHSPPPHAYVPSAEEIDPYIQKIWDELWLCTLPESEYYPIRDETVQPFLDGLKSSVDSTCCAPHKTGAMSTIREQCFIASNCSCNQHPLLHKFLAHVVHVFDKHMNPCMHNILIRKLLHERTN